MSKRDSLIAKVRAMLAKTVENGCTEAEAIAAMQMAEDIMQQNEITEDDLKLEGEKAVIDMFVVVRDPHKISQKLAYCIGLFTETKIWLYGKKDIKYAGLRCDIDFAMWLTQTLSRFVQMELKRYMWANGYQKLDAVNKRAVINGFVIGCVNRINERLREMVERRKTIVNSTALVIAKRALIDEVIAGIQLNKINRRNRGTAIYSHALDAGKMSGDKASFGRPVETGGLLRLK